MCNGGNFLTRFSGVDASAAVKCLMIFGARNNFLIH